MHSLISASLLLHLASASPLLVARQAVTDAIAPSAAPPAGCQISYNGIFGIAVQNITTGDSTTPSRRGFGGGGPPGGGFGGGPGGHSGGPPGGSGGPEGDSGGWADAEGSWGDADPTLTTTVCGCEDPPASTPPPPPPLTVAQVTQIGDGQIQGSLHTITVFPINQIFDGQIQQQRVTYAPSGYVPPSNTAAASSTVTVDPTSIGSSAAMSTAVASSSAAATSTTPSNTSTSSTTTTSSTTSPTSTDYDMVACRNPSSLQLHLSDSILTDALGRTGYIASNYQFQFDGPPQSNAIYTSGWGVCANGSLSLGGSTVFWQCLSGEFYNLYDRNWAAQCSPIELRVVTLVDCPDAANGTADAGNGTTTARRMVRRDVKKFSRGRRSLWQKMGFVW